MIAAAGIYVGYNQKAKCADIEWEWEVQHKKVDLEDQENIKASIWYKIKLQKGAAEHVQNIFSHYFNNSPYF